MVRLFPSTLMILWLLAVPLLGQYRMKHSNAYYLPENWPEHTLRLSERGEWKDIFDAGLRPYFYPGSTGASRLEFKHVRLRIVEPGGRMLPEYAVEYATVAPKPSGLSTLEMRGQNLTLEQAREQILPWLPLINRSEAELDEFLPKVKADPTGYDDRNFGAAPKGFSGGWEGEHKEVYTVGFQKAYREEIPLRFVFTVRWHRARTVRESSTFFKGPIPSPEGYEDIVIQAGENFGPDDAAEMMYAKGLPKLPGRGLGGTVDNVIEMTEDQEPENDQNQERDEFNGETERIAENEDGHHFEWIALATAVLLVLAVCGMFAFRMRKGSE